MPFRPGSPRPPNAGRRRGTPNKRTSQICDVIQMAAFQVGGSERLAAWIKQSPQNEFAFWVHVWPRLLPRHHGDLAELGLNAKIKPEEMASRLMEMGLPCSVFDIDPPTLDEPSNGNLFGEDFDEADIQAEESLNH